MCILVLDAASRIEGTHGSASLEDDVATTHSGSDITRTSAGAFAITDADAIAAGDYACLAGTTCVVQCPDVAIGYLTALAAAECCDVMGDREALSSHMAFAERKRRDMEQSIAKRTKESPRVIPRHSPLRSAGQVHRRGWRWGS